MCNWGCNQKILEMPHASDPPTRVPPEKKAALSYHTFAHSGRFRTNRESFSSSNAAFVSGLLVTGAVSELGSTTAKSRVFSVAP